MGRGINKVIVLGNLGQDPEVRFTASGNPVANLSVATSDSWLDKQSGQRQERTEWHRIVLFNKTAEIAQQYLKKGSKVYIEGRLQTRKWQDQSGQDKYSTEIVANDMQMLDSVPSNGGYNQPTQPMQQGGQPQQQQPMQQGGYPQQQPQQQPMNQGGYPQQQPMNQGGQPQQQQPMQQGGYPQQQPQQPMNQGGQPQQQRQQPQQQGGQMAPQPAPADDFMDDEIPF